MYKHVLQERHGLHWVLHLVKMTEKTTVIMSSLYVIPSAGAAFSGHLASCMVSMGYVLCKADPDLWMRPEICPEDKVQYYTLMLCYVDDILCIHQIANSVLCTSLFNSNRLHDVVWSCTMISTKHVQQIVSNLRPM